MNRFFLSTALICTLFFPLSSAAKMDSQWNTLIPTKSEDTTGFATKMETGDFQLTDVPVFLLRLIQFCVSIAGALALVSVMISGYQTLWGGISDGKPFQGKQRMTASIFGLSVAILAYIIVDLLLALFTE